MSTVEKLGFSMPVAASTLGHHRLLSRMLHREFELPYNAFTTLFVLRSVAGSVPVDMLTSYLILARKTMLTLLTGLEDRGLVRKLSDATDRRRMRIALTQAGASLTDTALASVDEVFENVFCRTLPSSEFSHFMGAAQMRVSLDAIRGEAVRLDTITDGRRYYSAEHFIYWRALAEEWADIVREESGLPFNAFGILALLDEKGPLDTTRVVEALMLPRSEVSARKSQLLARDAVVENPVGGDRRKTRLALTDAGRDLAHGLHASLDAYMARIDTTCDDETAALINTWYYRMYTNIRAYAGTLDGN